MYIAVLEGTGQPNSNLRGIRTWTDWGTREEFLKFMEQCRDLVVAENVTADEAIWLIRQTTSAARFEAALAQSADFPEQLSFHMANAAAAALQDGTYPGFRAAAYFGFIGLILAFLDEEGPCL